MRRNLGLKLQYIKQHLDTKRSMETCRPDLVSKAYCDQFKSGN